MGKRLFTELEIAEILKNKNVLKCSEKSITYEPEFKMRAMEAYITRGLPIKQIFIDSGFDLEIIGRLTPRWCLKRWKKSYKLKGSNGLVECRGRHGGKKKKTTDKSDAEKIMRLEAEIAYLKEENRFLAKLRALRKE